MPRHKLTIGTIRPYPASGLTTQRWMDEVPPTWVTIADLTTTQPHVSIDSVLYRTTAGRDTFPHVVAWDGRLYLEDGHGRIVRALLDEHLTWPCRILER